MTDQGASRDATGRDSCKVSKSFSAGETVEVRVTDQDATDHDKMAEVSMKLPGRLNQGSWVFAGGALRLSGARIE